MSLAKCGSRILVPIALCLHFLNLSLNVFVPPKDVIIVDEHGQRLRDIIGPYDEGSQVKLLCEAEGGSPPPTVTWWRELVLVDDTFAQTSQGFVRNELVLQKLQRRDLLTTYTCHASNTNRSILASTSIIMDMNLKPLDVRITSLQRSLSAGRKVVIECESWGARPKAVVTWWIDGKKILPGKETFTDNLTTSSLTFVPTVDDNGKILTCRAQNPALPNSGIENGWTLNVLYLPELKLMLGANIHPDAIKEGTDVFFECDVNANPATSEVKWRFNGRPLQGNLSGGVIVSNHSLVLQKVRKDHRGHYQCIATNSEGEGRSDDVMLKVKYTPVCRAQIAVHGVARYEAVNVSCQVEADPTDVTFRWALNNSVENIEIPSFMVRGTLSTVVYTPRTMLGYGALLCWAKNAIGNQKDPCVIRIIPAGSPESVKGCLVSNQTMTSLLVECDAGYDGGMRQQFHLEMYNSAVEHLQLNLSSTDVPVFHAKGLPHSTSFILVLYASNAKGRSDSVALVARTSTPPERRTTEKESTKPPPKEHTNLLSPLLGVLIGIVAVLVILAIGIIIVMRRQGRDPGKGPPIEDNVIKCDMPLRKDTDDMLETNVESPDVIPNATDNQGYSAEIKKMITKDMELTYEYIQSKDYGYDYVTPIRKPKCVQRDEDITYADLALKDLQCSVVTRIDPPTDYAELDFQRRLGIATYPWPVKSEECTAGMRPPDDYPLLGQNSESLSIPETTTQTTPL